MSRDFDAEVVFDRQIDCFAQREANLARIGGGFGLGRFDLCLCVLIGLCFERRDEYERRNYREAKGDGLRGVHRVPPERVLDFEAIGSQSQARRRCKRSAVSGIAPLLRERRGSHRTIGFARSTVVSRPLDSKFAIL